MTAVAVIDAIRDLMPLLDGMQADETVSEPAKSLPGRLYAWPRRLSPQKLEEANGRWDEADLRLRLLFTVAAKGESRVMNRARDISVALDDLADQVHTIVAANRRHPFWWDLYVDNVVYDAVRSFDARGVGLDLVARLNVPLPDSSSGSGS